MQWRSPKGATRTETDYGGCAEVRSTKGFCRTLRYGGTQRTRETEFLKPKGGDRPLKGKRFRSKVKGKSL